MTRVERQRKYVLSPKGQAYLKSAGRAERVKNSENIRRRKHVEDVRVIKLERGCQKCGFKAHHAALQFHHRNPKTKRFEISRSRNYSWAAILEEIKKCDVLCTNCHAILEYGKAARNENSRVVQWQDAWPITV